MQQQQTFRAWLDGQAHGEKGSVLWTDGQAIYSGDTALLALAPAEGRKPPRLVLNKQMLGSSIYAQQEALHALAVKHLGTYAPERLVVLFHVESAGRDVRPHELLGTLRRRA